MLPLDLVTSPDNLLLDGSSKCPKISKTTVNELTAVVPLDLATVLFLIINLLLIMQKLQEVDNMMSQSSSSTVVVS